MSILARLRSLLSPPANAAKAYKQAGGLAEHSYWMFAAPVHVVLGRDNLFLPSPAPTLAARADAESLILSLNQHFSELGCRFYLQNDHWYLGLDNDPKIMTSPLEKVLNQDLAPFQPRGEGALAWASFQNEIQMLLFQHPINAAREARRELPINSIWFYGLAAT